eukprot:COSAG01_NODE_13299_length_1604_cov_40.065781_1_plen_177_part_00
MRREIERDLDAIGEKIEKFVEHASWGGQGQLVEIETQIPEKLASSRSGIKGTGHAIKEKQRKPGPGNTLTVWCTDIGPASSDALVTVEVSARKDHVEFDEDGHTIRKMYARLPPVSYPAHEPLIGKVLKKVKEVIPRHLLSELLVPSGKILERKDGVCNFVPRRYESHTSVVIPNS